MDRGDGAESVIMVPESGGGDENFAPYSAVSALSARTEESSSSSESEPSLWGTTAGAGDKCTSPAVVHRVSTVVSFRLMPETHSRQELMGGVDIRQGLVLVQYLQPMQLEPVSRSISCTYVGSGTAKLTTCMISYSTLLFRVAYWTQWRWRRCARRQWPAS